MAKNFVKEINRDIISYFLKMRVFKGSGAMFLNISLRLEDRLRDFKVLYLLGFGIEAFRGQLTRFLRLPRHQNSISATFSVV